VADPCVDFSADCGVYGVDGNGDMANLQFGKFINIGEQVEAVGCHAEQHFGILFAHKVQGFHCLVGVGEGVARARNAYNGDVGGELYGPFQVVERLAGGEQFA